VRNEVKFSESAGKTIEAVRYAGWSDTAVITFTDGTFACIGTTLDGGDVTLCDGEFRRYGYGDKVLIEIGVFTAEELAAQKQAEEIEAAKKRLEAERRQYERLRAQFESGV